MAFTTARRVWDVERDGKTYRIEMEDEYFFGRRVVRVDGVVAYSGRTVLSDHSGAYQFDLGGRPAFLKISTNGFTYSYDLVTDVPNISTPRRSTAGPVSLTQRAPTIGAIVALLAFGLGALVAIDLTADGRAWREPVVALLGTPANARVIGAGTTSRDARRIRYRFEVGGRSFTHQGYVSRERYDLAMASGIVPIRYLAPVPDINAFDADVSDLLFADALVLVLFGGTGALFLYAAWKGVRNYLVWKRLEVAGQETEGRVTKVRNVRGRYMMVTGCVVDYEYSAAFVSYRGVSRVFPLDAATSFPVGASVRVRYDPNRPQDSRLVT